MSLPLHHIFSALQGYPELYAKTEFQDILHFVHLAVLLKPYLMVSRSFYVDGPVERLPAYIHGFLVDALGLDDDVAKLLWEIFKDWIWEQEWNEKLQRELGNEYIPYFLKHGTNRNLTFHVLLPPTLTCLDANCIQYPRGARTLEQGRRYELAEPCPVRVSVFSRDYGPLPATSISLYCRGCKTRYYHNYYVHSGATVRTYYLASPRYVHSAEHFFVDKETCELFTAMMVEAWTSASNCAKVYNSSIGKSSFKNLLPIEYSSRLKLDHELVWNALYLFWLLEDHEHHGNLLQLDHQASSQADRLSAALQARNLRLVGTGQEEWNHACELCCWLKENDDGEIEGAVRSVVVDGVTVGRPCCSVHDCQERLTSVKSRFCQKHVEQNQHCCVRDCKSLVEPGFQTCSNVAHRKLELRAHEENRAMFQLKRRLERSGAIPTEPTPDAIVSGSQTDEPPPLAEISDEEDEGEPTAAHCKGKKASGNRPLKARFGRRRTHNEELAVASCGVILGRATFFGSEAPNGVRDFLKGLFPTKQSLPQVIWHDNNCQILSMLQHAEEGEDRAYFSDCAMPVDVFHFKSKHKETDVQCNVNCNPANWPDLITREGRWRFNSSAAEQTNCWFGKYLPMVREMESIRYDFFLDEMILRRNRNLVEELEAKNLYPYHIPREALLG